MLKINFIAETGSDYITPLTVAHALIEQATNDNGEFEDAVDCINELSEHLQSFVHTQEHKQWRETCKREMFEGKGEVRPE